MLVIKLCHQITKESSNTVSYMEKKKSMLPHCVPTKRVYFYSFKTDMSVAGRFNLCFALQTLHCLSATFKIQNNTKYSG